MNSFEYDFFRFSCVPCPLPPLSKGWCNGDISPTVLLLWSHPCSYMYCTIRTLVRAPVGKADI